MEEVVDRAAAVALVNVLSKWRQSVSRQGILMWEDRQIHIRYMLDI